MSGPGKRVHEDFTNAMVIPPLKQEDQLNTITGNVEIIPSDKGLHVEGIGELRPSKLPRVDHTNRFQKRMETGDLIANNTTLVSDSKGDGKLKGNVDEKGFHVDSKMTAFEEKGELDAWKDARLDQVHDTRIVSNDTRIASSEKMSRIPGNSSSWRREHWSENKDEPREIWKDGRDDKSHFKEDIYRKKGDKDVGKDVGLDFMHDVKNPINERTNRSNPWRRDQRVEHRDETRKDYKESESAPRPILDHKDSIWTGRKCSMEEEGELRDSEEALMQVKGETKKEDRDKEHERKIKDHSLKEREDKEKAEKIAWWESEGMNTTEIGRWDKEKEKREKAYEKKESRDYGEKQDIVSVKQEMEESEVPKKSASEGSNFEDNMKLERKSPKDIDAVEIDERDKKDEKDNDKMLSDAICPEDNEKDKDSFINHNIQQKKRMLRPRGHSAISGKDGFKNADGTQGSSESTSIIYKPGEYMTELLKLWREYESSVGIQNGEDMGLGRSTTIEIRIPAKLVTTSNHQVRGSQLWGTDVYTDDSDLVAVLMHTGYYRPTASYPPPSVQELCATIQVLPPQDSYASSLRNNVRSRAWGAASGCSYSIVRCKIVKVCGGHIDLHPCLTRTSSVAPTLAPAVMERTMTTRAASSNVHKQQRFVQEVTIQYNLCNEPWMKYSTSVVADRGLKKSQYTSARLRKGEVLYLETHRKRYELSYDREKVSCNGGYGITTATSGSVSVHGDKSKDKDIDRTLSNHNGDKTQGRGNNSNDRGHTQGLNADGFDHYKWALCKEPLPLKMMLAKGVPLPHEYVEVLENGLAWEEIQWSQTGIWVRGKEYRLARAHFLSQNEENPE